MKKLITGLLMATTLTFTVTACGGAAGKIESLAKEACECKDIKCFDEVNVKMDKALDGLKTEYKKKEDVPKDLAESLGKAMKSAGECRGKLMKAEKK